jgi:hypothetical protein
MHGTDQRDARKARTGFEKFFPVVKTTQQELKTLAAMKRNAGRDGWKQIMKDEQEANEIKSIKFRQADEKYREHFIGLVEGREGAPSIIFSVFGSHMGETSL